MLDYLPLTLEIAPSRHSELLSEPFIDLSIRPDRPPPLHPRHQRPLADKLGVNEGQETPAADEEAKIDPTNMLQSAGSNN